MFFKTILLCKCCSGNSFLVFTQESRLGEVGCQGSGEMVPRATEGGWWGWNTGLRRLWFVGGKRHSQAQISDCPGSKNVLSGLGLSIEEKTEGVFLLIQTPKKKKIYLYYYCVITWPIRLLRDIKNIWGKVYIAHFYFSSFFLSQGGCVIGLSVYLSACLATGLLKKLWTNLSWCSH